MLLWNVLTDLRIKSEVNASEKSHILFSLIRHKFYTTGEEQEK